MFCSRCGQASSDSDEVCPSCGHTLPRNPYAAPTSRQPSGPGADLPGGPIATNLARSILATLLCCLPPGIVAIVYASRVRSLQVSGDLPGARRAAELARFWSNVSIGMGLLSILVNLLFMLTAPGDG